MIKFTTSNTILQRVYDAALSKSYANIQSFAGRRALVEGGGYEKIWIETQPMGGEMFAGYDMELARNNVMLFMENQRGDGRLPGSIRLENGKLVPEFNKLQGFCFAEPALNLYYWMERDAAYLKRLYECLEAYDAYLWRTRGSGGNGCLEAWCVTDTGEDGALRYGDAPFWWTEETAPVGCAVVPIQSMDIMGYSFAARNTLAKISAILENGGAERWQRDADAVRAKIREYLWDDERGACFDRDKDGNVLPTLLHNNLRLMHWGAMYPDMAERFVDEHLLDEEEFWTPMPLPSVAANDPLFRNSNGNDWSGQPEGLTYQRAVSALNNYGFAHLLNPLFGKLLNACSDCVFSQQFDTFTGAHSSKLDGYGPTMLSILEYTAQTRGIRMAEGKLLWSAFAREDSDFTIECRGKTYRLVGCDNAFEGFVNGRKVLGVPYGKRIVTDMDGEII
ncbi:MAG: hypothetical protein LBD16_06505 [Oscillospiraceae bacterium]|jgi:hypothetical protein|nr:hypothetical protein [Oscillospiraceae bacterium]